VGDPIPQGEGAVFEGNVATHCNVIGHSMVSCVKVTEPIKMPYWMKTQVGPRNQLLDGGADPAKGRGNFGDFLGNSKALAVFTAAFTAEWII